MYPIMEYQTIVPHGTLSSLVKYGAQGILVPVLLLWYYLIGGCKFNDIEYSAYTQGKWGAVIRLLPFYYRSQPTVVPFLQLHGITKLL